MKHKLKVTLLLIALFFIAQIIGLLVVDKTSEKLPYGIERPEIEQRIAFLPTFIAILIMTFFIYILLKFKLYVLWKIWFFIAVIFALSLSFSSFIPETIAFILALVLAIIKVFKPNVYVHNFTELFIYGALAAIFFKFFDIVSISILLILISIYDYIAVYKTIHMITLAKSQSKANVFAGFFIPYKKEVAVLGGGDVGFPLLFTSVVMKDFGLYSLIITISVTISLSFLLFYSKKKKFYPAMPIITLGCFIGYFILQLLL
jgi:presenilin-like A22 family membrane protease